MLTDLAEWHSPTLPKLPKEVLFTPNHHSRLLPFYQKANMQRNSKDAFKVKLPVQKQVF